MPSTIPGTEYAHTVLALMKISQISKWDLSFTSEFTDSENYFTAYTNLLTYKYSRSLTMKLNQM